MQKHAVRYTILLLLLYYAPLVAKSHKAEAVIKEAEKKLPSACLFYFKMYLNSPSPKAFAYAMESSQKVTCRFSSASKNQQRANEVALLSCDKSRLEKKIKRPCQLYIIKGSIAKSIKQKEFEKKYRLNLAHIKQKEKKSTKESSQQKKRKKRLPIKERAKKGTHNPLLEKAILATDLKKIQKLIKAGADVNTKASDNTRALFVAVAKGDIAFAKYLLKKGAYPYFRTKDRNNLLIAAIMSGKNAMLKLMLEQHISPNIPCEDGNTPLHFALMMFDDQMMRTLYQYHALDTIKNKKGKSVRDLAKELHVDLKRIKR